MNVRWYYTVDTPKSFRKCGWKGPREKQEWENEKNSIMKVDRWPRPSGCICQSRRLPRQLVPHNGAVKMLNDWMRAKLYNIFISSTRTWTELSRHSRLNGTVDLHSSVKYSPFAVVCMRCRTLQRTKQISIRIHNVIIKCSVKASERYRAMNGRVTNQERRNSSWLPLVHATSSCRPSKENGNFTQIRFQFFFSTFMSAKEFALSDESIGSQFRNYRRSIFAEERRENTSLFRITISSKLIFSEAVVGFIILHLNGWDGPRAP